LGISVGSVGNAQQPELILRIVDESSICRSPDPGVDSDERCADNMSVQVLFSAERVQQLRNVHSHSRLTSDTEVWSLGLLRAWAAFGLERGYRAPPRLLLT
jgi:hypothetical protein